MIRNASAVKGLTATSDLSLKDGYLVKASGTGVALITGATDPPLGVVLSGDTAAGFSSVGLMNFGGIVSLKLSATPGTVALGTKLVLTADGSVKALPTATGTYLQVGTALEVGAANELIEATLQEPRTVTV